MWGRCAANTKLHSSSSDPRTIRVAHSQLWDLSVDTFHTYCRALFQEHQLHRAELAGDWAAVQAVCRSHVLLCHNIAQT